METNIKNDILNDTKQKMEKAVESFERELSKVRTGRATPALLDGIRVDYYGTPTPLSQVASVSVPESRQMVIQPWDTTVIAQIEKAIQKSDLGLTPTSDGKIVRINIPALSEQRRKDLVKSTKKIAEDSRVILRNIRRDINEKLKNLKKDKSISEDDQFKLQDDTQKLTDNYIKKIDEILLAKENEIMEF
jgi:ribosome recycling factor